MKINEIDIIPSFDRFDNEDKDSEILKRSKKAKFIFATFDDFTIKSTQTFPFRIAVELFVFAGNIAIGWIRLKKIITKKVVGYQVRMLYIWPDFRRKNITYRLYKSIIDKVDLVSDHDQTIESRALWKKFLNDSSINVFVTDGKNLLEPIRTESDFYNAYNLATTYYQDIKYRLLIAKKA